MPPTVHLARRDTVRLIATGRLKDPVLLPLAPDPAALDDLAELEGATNGRLRARRTGLPGLAPEELVYGRPGQIFVNAAFTHTRPGGNRFNGGERGAWYCAFTGETALREVAYHLTRALDEIGRYDNVTDYAELFADFIGPFHDLRHLDPRPACLDPDPAIGYPAGQALARELRGGASNGVVYPSVRHPDGTRLAAFHPSLVQNVREGAVRRLAWRGAREPAVTRAAL